MARRLREVPGGMVFHVMNRASMGVELFAKEFDYLAFERVLGEGKVRWPGARVLVYVVMPNHFHLVVWPRVDGELSGFMRWVTMTFSQRWHAHRGSAGRGRVFQGRFKSFPVERGGHVLDVCRYVERNALRAGLVRRAEEWRWCSLACRLEAVRGNGGRSAALLDEWPVDRGEEAAWVRRVNGAESVEELAALRRSAARGVPYGEEPWVRRTAGRLGLASTLRARGRPRKGVKGGGKGL